jgi:hypothetical protein
MHDAELLTGQVVDESCVAEPCFGFDSLGSFYPNIPVYSRFSMINPG